MSVGGEIGVTDVAVAAAAAVAATGLRERTAEDLSMEVLNKLQSHGWVFTMTAHEFMGCRIRHFFDGSHSDGTIVGVLPPERNQGRWVG